MNDCVVQYGSRDVLFGGLKGFSRICSDIGVKPKQSEGILEGIWSYFYFRLI